MKKEYYLQILQENGKKGFKKKKKKKEWLNQARTEVLERPFHRPDLNPIQNMWTVLKKQVFAFAKCQNYCIYIFELADLAMFSKDL